MCKVSVIIPCYNCGKYLCDAVDSVKRQTFSDWEIIIVDDGSTDAETKDVLSSVSTDKSVRIIYQNNNGPAHARNTGIHQAKGELILPLDADDTISPKYMEEAVPLFSKKSNFGIVYCRAQKFGNETGEWFLPDFSARRMAYDNMIFVTAFFKKSDWELVGGFPDYAMYGMEDYAFWLRILRLGRDVYRIDKILFNYRIRDKSRTVSFSSNKNKMVEQYAKVFRDNIDFFYKNAEGIYQYRFKSIPIEQHEYIIKKILDEQRKYDIRNILKNFSPYMYILAKKMWHIYKRFFA